jgi:hypothetical protein
MSSEKTPDQIELSNQITFMRSAMETAFGSLNIRSYNEGVHDIRFSDAVLLTPHLLEPISAYGASADEAVYRLFSMLSKGEVVRLSSDHGGFAIPNQHYRVNANGRFEPAPKPDHAS